MTFNIFYIEYMNKITWFNYLYGVLFNSGFKFSNYRQTSTSAVKSAFENQSFYFEVLITALLILRCNSQQRNVLNFFLFKFWAWENIR